MITHWESYVEIWRFFLFLPSFLVMENLWNHFIMIFFFSFSLREIMLTNKMLTYTYIKTFLHIIEIWSQGFEHYLVVDMFLGLDHKINTSYTINNNFFLCRLKLEATSFNEIRAHVSQAWTQFWTSPQLRFYCLHKDHVWIFLIVFKCGSHSYLVGIIWIKHLVRHFIF